MQKQLFILFFAFPLIFSSCYINKNPKICIQPFDNFDTEYAEIVAESIREYYGLEVTVLPAIEIPKSAFINVKSPRYRADSLIRFLKRIKPETYDYILGLTNQDISTTKYSNWKNKTVKEPEWKYLDFGIFGLGFRPGPSCIVSTYRLYAGNVPENTMIERMKKIACHELGHNLGLKHCPDKKCLMQDAAETIRTIDAVEPDLCEKCKRKIKLKEN